MIGSGLSQHRKPMQSPTAMAGMRRRLRGLFAIITLGPGLLFCTSTTLYAQQPQPLTATELQIQAAYLYKFGAFINWPNPLPGNKFSICVLGRDPFGATLDGTVKGESLNGVPLTAERISTPQEAGRCRIVFVSSSEESRLKPVLEELHRFSVLTVSDIPHFTDRGGMIEFVLENGRIRFDVNLASAERDGLTLSSQLLKVAAAVKRGGQD